MSLVQTARITLALLLNPFGSRSSGSIPMFASRLQHVQSERRNQRATSQDIVSSGAS